MSGPRIVFLPDFGSAVGGGHVMRSLTLAQALTLKGARCAFAVNDDTASAVRACVGSCAALARGVGGARVYPHSSFRPERGTSSAEKSDSNCIGFQGSKQRRPHTRLGLLSNEGLFRFLAGSE